MEYSSDNDGEYDDDYYNAGETYHDGRAPRLIFLIRVRSLHCPNISSAATNADTLPPRPRLTTNYAPSFRERRL